MRSLLIILFLVAPVQAGVRIVSVGPPKPAAPIVQAAPVRIAYPLRRSWWSGCGSWQHLTVGEHRGKFDHAWLASLTWSEVQSLHSDDHEGRVKWKYVVRPAAAAAPVQRVQGCPNGQCPTGRVGLFGRLLGK